MDRQSAPTEYELEQCGEKSQLESLSATGPPKGSLQYLVFCLAQRRQTLPQTEHRSPTNGSESALEWKSRRIRSKQTKK